MFALFACATWLAHRHAAGAAGDDGGGGAAAACAGALCAALALGGGLLCAGGLGAWVFAICDDHLKLARPRAERPDLGAGPAWFELWLTRLCAWALAVVPVVTSYVVCRLTLVPLALFGSLEPEHARHHEWCATTRRDDTTRRPAAPRRAAFSRG